MSKVLPSLLAIHMLVIGRNHSVSKVLPSLLAIQMLALGKKQYQNEITHVWNGNSFSFMVHYTLPLLCWFVSYNWAALTARRWATSQPPGKTWTKYQKENPTLMKIWWNQDSKCISASSQLHKLCLISVDFLSFQKGFGLFCPLHVRIFSSGEHVSERRKNKPN